MMTQSLTHELIRASAGTGKTYALTNRYLQLLHMGQRSDEILASTFTRKAAGEILGRVLLRLAQAATDSGKLGELQTALGGEPLTHDECLALLVETAGRLHRLRIGTLDSFFAQLAGSFALEFGLPPGWRIAEEHEDAVLRARAIEAVLDNEDPSNLLTLVHALTRGETTRSLDREVRDKVEMLYSIYRGSSRDAWHRVPRMRELAGAHLAEAVETLRTIPLPEHKTWQKTHAKAVGEAEAGNWAAFIKNGIAAKVAAGEESYCRKPIEPHVAAAYQTLLDHARAILLNQLANQTEATYQLLDKFHAQYQQLKSQTRALRFEDITYQLVQNCLPLPAGVGRGARGDSPWPGQGAPPALDHFAFRLDAHLHHLLLDEFQDTSLAQWSVIRPFAKRITSADSNESFFCVGDVKQAIYGWRGGVAEIFDAVTHELDDIHQRPLDTSWRSSPHVITAVNQIFQNVHRHNNLGDLEHAVAGWQQQFNEHRTARPKQRLNGYVCLQAAHKANHEDAEQQKEITLRFAAEQVAKWKEKAPGFEIGVLVRKNDAVRRLIYELRQLGIDASEEGGSSLDDSAAVRLVMSLMQLADHPGDLVARFHIATSPLAAAIGLPGAVEETCAIDGSCSGESKAAMKLASKSGSADAGRLARRIRRQLVDDGYGRTVYAWAGQLAPACNRRELRRLEKLIGLAYQYDDAATSRPRDFVAYVAAAKVRDPIAADVRVMTVHQAKGLEFDIVVLADLEANLIGQRDDLVVGRPSPTEPIDRVCRRCSKEVQQLMPASWQQLFREADEQDLAESLCVLYVAVTRAVHAVHMIVAPSSDGERSLHKTFGGLLRAALTDGTPLTPEQIAYETGDRAWFENPGVDRQPSAGEVAARAESLAPLEVTLAAPAARRWRGLQRVSPSGLEGGTHVRLADHASDSGIDRAAALARGTLIHAWFEQIYWLDDGPPTDDHLREVAATLPELALSSEDIDRQLAEFRAMLAQRNVAACLSRDHYNTRTLAQREKGQDHSLSVRERSGARGASSKGSTPIDQLDVRVENERPIAVRDGDRLLVGNIDRLVTIFENDQPIAADIIDYKTDAIPSGDKMAVAKKVDFYRPQLAAYRGAVRSFCRLESSQVSAKLLFVGADAIEEV